MTFLSAALVVFRESFEAFLVVGILFGVARKLAVPKGRTRILVGTLLGVLLAVVVGALLLSLATDLRAHYKTAAEALASLVAVAVLTYMIVWMYGHTQTLIGGMHHKIKADMETGALGSLFFVPFVAVVREGFETVLFLAADPDAPSGLAMVGALAAGLGLAVVLGALLFSGVVRLSVERFFAATGALLVLFAGWVLRYGLHELGELIEQQGGAWLEPGEFLADIGAWIGGALYVLGFGAWYLRPLLNRKRMKPTRTD
ncbi:MAG: high-affinity iron transporter [Thermoplasmata archaeon]|nr:high-affinity iron transporter [Thermoplasmata archaeon]